MLQPCSKHSFKYIFSSPYVIENYHTCVMWCKRCGTTKIENMKWNSKEMISTGASSVVFTPSHEDIETTHVPAL